MKKRVRKKGNMEWKKKGMRMRVVKEDDMGKKTVGVVGGRGKVRGAGK